MGVKKLGIIISSCCMVMGLNLMNVSYADEGVVDTSKDSILVKKETIASVEDFINLKFNKTKVESSLVKNESIVPLKLNVEHKVTSVKRVIEQVPSYDLELLGTYNVSAYCPCTICCEKWGASPVNKTTSIGVGAYDGNTVAVDPKVIPYGTAIYIEGVGIKIASDCGGAIQKNKLDVYFANHNDALKFGRKHLKVYKVNVGEKVKQ